MAGQQATTPGALAESLELPAATLSFHLKALSNARLVTQERVSRNAVYRASFGQMNDLLTYLTENCCLGAECAVDSDGDDLCLLTQKERFKFTLLTRDLGPHLVDRYSERKESAEELPKRVNQRAI